MTDAPDKGAPADDARAPFDAEAEWQRMMAEEAGNEAEQASPAEPEDAADDDAPEDDAPGEAEEPRAEAGEADKGDPWAGAPESARQEYEKTKQQWARDRGRLAALQRKIDDLQRARAEPQTEAEQQQTQDDIETLLTQAQKLTEDYEDFKPLQTALRAVAGRQGKLEQTIQSLMAEREQQTASVVATQVSLFEQQAPDGYEVISKDVDRFLSWVDDQPRRYRDAFERNKDVIVDAAEALEVVNSYKQFLGIQPGKSAPPSGGKSESLAGKRQRQLDAAASPRSSAPPMKSGEPAPDAPAEEHWKWFARMEAEGRQ